MKLLLLGKNGQVGWELQRALAPLGELVACSHESPPELRADFSRPDSLPELVRRVRPDVIVNAAAHTAVDKAESEPELARALNATAPGVLAQQAAAHGALLVHFSSDYVFDGSGDQPRDEDAATGPLGVYGSSKLEGEQLIRASGCRHLLLRTSWVYAARGGNFARTMLRLAGERDTLDVVDDQVGAPTGAELLADVSAHAIREVCRSPSLAGTYHCVPAGTVSWHGYARFVVEWAQRHGQVLRTQPDRIRPIASRDYPTPARRPLNSRLATARLEAAFGLRLPPWQHGVERMLREVLQR